MKPARPLLLNRKTWLTLIFSLCVSFAFSQSVERAFKQASNCNCSLLTPTAMGYIQWYGPCYNGYCDGNGTVKYFDQNGNYFGSYVGNVTQGKLNGYGTRYYGDGSIIYRGHVVNNEFADQAPFELANDLIGNFVVDSLLSGGINRHCDIVKAVFAQDGSLQEIRYRVTCNGQIVTDNFYDCTLVITPFNSPYVDMVNVNSNAQTFIALNFLRYAKRFLDWANQQQRNNR